MPSQRPMGYSQEFGLGAWPRGAGGSGCASRQVGAAGRPSAPARPLGIALTPLRRTPGGRVRLRVCRPWGTDAEGR